MFNKKAKSPTNVKTYLIILFIFLIFIRGIMLLGTDLVLNDNANLDNASIEYIANLNGIDLDEFQATSDQIENPVLFSDNTSQGNPKDYALEFQFSKERGATVENAIKQVFNMPRVILIDVLKLPSNNWEWALNYLKWVWRLLIILSLIYLARGIIS